MNALQKFLRGEEGTTAVEYCVVLGMIIVVCIAGISTVGGTSGGMWGRNSTKLNSVMSP
ncbi:MAG: Flp family type IVb pilin [Planctomycetota bacterium]